MASIAQPRAPQTRASSAKRRRLINAILVNGTLFLICLVWVIPTLGLLISSFRPRDEIRTSGWWTVLPHQSFATVEQVELGRGAPVDQPIPVAGTTVTDEQLRAGVILPDGRQAIWGNRRARVI